MHEKEGNSPSLPRGFALHRSSNELDNAFLILVALFVHDVLGVDAEVLAQGFDVDIRDLCFKPLCAGTVKGRAPVFVIR